MDEALKQLHDLHLPEAPSIWPLAPGWWLLGFLIATLVGALLIGAYRMRRRGRPFRLAQRRLDHLLAQAREQPLAAREFADLVSALLKRALIHGAQQHDAAALTGAAWLVYLDKLVKSDVFSNGAGAALGDARFTRDFQWDPTGLHAAAHDALRAIRKSAHR
jgi:hypothetical protein